ncbi:MAG: NAD(P)/FAD-dependent oxidoreductase [Thermodesulfovibrionales bacterium]|nr:NAD(P)/FAD-dependent oxidoreductase [Thermodesulfovibrionales bacterium]
MSQNAKPLIKKDVVIIGAGASGLMCAREAGERNRSVLVLEHMNRTGKKIRISGGGRCNFTNIHLQPDQYLSDNPYFCKSALARFTPRDFIGMAEHHGIAYGEKEEGQMFCQRSSGDIVKMLDEECRNAGVKILLNCRVGSITKTGHFSIATNSGRIETGALVIATGGLSYPELGATDLGFRIAQKFGLRVTRLRPALVPLLFSRRDLHAFKGLSGISFDAVVRCKGIQFRGKVLFTHQGMSGPAILQISSYWDCGDEISIDLMPGMDSYALLTGMQKSRMELSNLFSAYLPRRFCQQWCAVNAPSRPVCQYTEKELREIAHKIHHWTIRFERTAGYAQAEVTAGGIDTSELSSRTMESKKVPGLFFAGEVIDIAGQLGGYNLQWAWSSGFAAGQYA